MASRSTIRIKHTPLPEDSFLGNFLDPLDRLSETLFALMIMLSFTLAIRFSLLESGSHAPVSPEYVNKLVIMMLTAIVGWGTIDGILYALLSVFDRGEKQRLFVRIQTAATLTRASRPLPKSWTPSWSRSPGLPSANCCMKTFSPTCPTAGPSRWASGATI